LPSISFADPRALARAATLIENRRPEATALIAELFAQTGRAVTVGITGAPGVGKSSLVNQLIRQLRSEQQRVGVLAVDPSSAWTGGAILGDRIRMQDHHGDPDVFIRSMATRGYLGGLARGTLELTLLLDAAGADTILIETVGVGQDEIDIARLASVTVVVLVPGLGDDVQAIKAGIMEIADVFVINKADHAGTDKLETEVRLALALVTRHDGWMPPIVRTVATEGRGIPELIQAIRHARTNVTREDQQVQAWRARLLELVKDRLIERIPAETLDREAAEVAARRRDPYTSVETLIKETL
jgi:LAO/AO transport system kinase